MRFNNNMKLRISGAVKCGAHVYGMGEGVKGDSIEWSNIKV